MEIGHNMCMELFARIKRINELSESADGVHTLIDNIADGAVVSQAINFAITAHGQQMRKYVNRPYVSHCFAVANIVKLVGGDAAQMAAAVLHDTVEDTPVTIDQVQEAFGVSVALMVEQLTDVSKSEDGNRKTRKAIDREHTAQACAETKTVKLADLIHNSFSIVRYDPDFAKVYLREKILLLDVLEEGDPELYKVAKLITKEGLATLDGAAKSASVFI